MSTKSGQLQIHQTRRLHAAWVEFLSRYVWDKQGHFTFRHAGPMDKAFAGLGGWANGLTRLTQGPIHWVAFPEPTSTDRWHLHCLLQGTANVDPEVMEARWRRRHGHFVQIDPFDRQSGIISYITKLVSVEFSEARFSNGFLKAAKVVEDK